MDVLIIGGGIGGLTLAPSLHQVGITCRVFEAASDIKAVGVGINLLPIRYASLPSSPSRMSQQRQR
jgi:2-polyprenyl-6-methoxyphenol hydroxylase-like FAD-dependent oxidoreductase